MRTLDSMYDLIFQDESIVELFLNFWGPTWKKLEVDRKIEIMTELNEKVSKIYGYTTPILNQVNDKNYGSFGAFNWKLTLNPKVLQEDTGWETLDTYFHELRHAFQHRAIENELTDQETIDDDIKKLWQRNFLPGNYFGGQSEYYLYQPVEEDAWRTGMLFAREAYKICKQHYKVEDQTWKDYCSLHKNIIVDFISENEDSLAKLNAISNSITEIYNEREEDLEQIEMGKKFIAELENKNPSEMTMEEVGILLSPYAFTYIEIERKIEILKRYTELIKIGKRTIPIKENTVASIAIGNHLYSVSDPHTLINGILSIQFTNIVDYILKGEDIGYSLNDNAQKELKLNLYKNKNNKRINFIKDSDNLFVFSLQPYARYESTYILKEFLKLKEIELNHYGKNYDGWKFWEDFYDNKKIYKTAEIVLGIKFKDYYRELLATYVDRIQKDTFGLLALDGDLKNLNDTIQKKVHERLKGTTK